MNRFVRSCSRVGTVLAPAAFLLLASAAFASGGAPPGRETRSELTGLKPRARNQYAVVPLVSDGFAPAPAGDPNLVNAWGLALSGSGFWWVADNGTDRATVYTGDGVAQSLVVALPAGSAPTGVTFYAGLNFVVSDGANSGPARFIFAGENGEIFGWGPAVSPPGQPGRAFLVLDRSASGTIYKGIAFAATDAGDRLYVTDFHNRKVDVFDGSFEPVSLAEGAFVDPRVPEGFSPFGIRNIQGRIFVTFARQDPAGQDDVAGQGFGFVSVFDTEGVFLARIATGGLLNSPWGLALAPEGFGRFSGDLLVGNFGDGKIVAYRISDDLRKAEPEGVLRGPDRRPIVVDGLWAINFGNGAAAAPRDTLFFTAGPGDEQHGLFGRIEPR